MNKLPAIKVKVKNKPLDTDIDDTRFVSSMRKFTDKIIYVIPATEVAEDKIYTHFELPIQNLESWYVGEGYIWHETWIESVCYGKKCNTCTRRFKCLTTW